MSAREIIKRHLRACGILTAAGSPLPPQHDVWQVLDELERRIPAPPSHDDDWLVIPATLVNDSEVGNVKLQLRDLLDRCVDVHARDVLVRAIELLASIQKEAK